MVKGAANREYSIQRRILVGSGLTLLAVTVLLFFLGRWYAHRAADEAFDRVLGAAALSIADTITLQDGALSVDLPHSAFSILGTSRLNRIFYRTVAPDGSLLTGSPILGLEIPHGNNSRIRLSDSVYRGEKYELLQSHAITATQEAAAGSMFWWVKRAKRGGS